MTEDVYVYIVPGLPVPEVLTPCEGGYTAYISADLCREDQQKRYDHVVRHIKRRGFEAPSAEQAELDARK